MRWKQSLTPLDDVPELDSRVWAKLMEHHITTAEEFVGQIEAEPENMAVMLDITDADLQALAGRAYAVIGSDVAAAIKAQRGQKRTLGALPPPDDAG